MKAHTSSTEPGTVVTGPGARGPQQSFYRRYEAIILGGASLLIALIAWEWAAGQVSTLFFSGPSAVWKEAVYDWTEGNLKSDLIYSGRNFILGLAAAIVVGVGLGILVGWYRVVRLILDPFISALNATPRVAMVPLIIIWLGTGYTSKLFIVFISAVFPILLNTIGGIRALDQDLLRSARAFCASDWQIFKTIALPGSVPFILTGIRQGVALGLIGVVVGEMLGGSEGVGFMVAYGGNTFQAEKVFAGVTIIALSGIILTWLAGRLERRFSRWRPER